MKVEVYGAVLDCWKGKERKNLAAAPGFLVGQALPRLIWHEISRLA